MLRAERGGIMSDLVRFLEWAEEERARIRSVIAELESQPVPQKRLIAGHKKVIKAIDDVAETFKDLDQHGPRVPQV
jgi:hypothetical protein